MGKKEAGVGWGLACGVVGGLLACNLSSAFGFLTTMIVLGVVWVAALLTNRFRGHSAEPQDDQEPSRI